MAFLVFLAFIFEVVDSGLGMMYGTLLSPILLTIGLPAADVIPSILISQAVGGLVGSICHHRRGNSDFSDIKKDLGLGFLILGMGLLSSLFGVLFAKYISDVGLKIYIATLAIIMGGLCLSHIEIKFSRWTVMVIGLLATFNKASTGGGFGPLCSTGLIVGGVKSKTSIAITTFSEVPLCLISFVIYCAIFGITDMTVALPMIIGAGVGGYFGPIITAKLNLRLLKRLVGSLAIISGCLILIKVFL